MVPSTLTTAVAPPMIRSRIQWIKGYEEKGPMKSHWTEYVTDTFLHKIDGRFGLTIKKTK
jgi:hypothetical protein